MGSLAMKRAFLPPDYQAPTDNQVSKILGYTFLIRRNSDLVGIMS